MSPDPFNCVPGWEDEYTHDQAKQLIEMVRAINRCAASAMNFDSESAAQAIEGSDLLLDMVDQMITSLFPSDSIAEQHSTLLAVERLKGHNDARHEVD